MCHKPLNKEAYEGERKLTLAYEDLAMAHHYLMYAHMDYPEDAREAVRREANYWFDKAEENMREGFKVDAVHVARYSENPEPYKRALGAILECVEDSYLESAFIAICKLHMIDPDDAHRSYRHWLIGDDESWETTPTITM